MKRMKYTDDQLKRMQEMRNNGMSTRALADYFLCGESTIRQLTFNPRPRKKTTHNRSEAAKKGHQISKAEEEDSGTIRVLSSVPAGFKAPSRGMGW